MRHHLLHGVAAGSHRVKDDDFVVFFFQSFSDVLGASFSGSQSGDKHQGLLPGCVIRYCRAQHTRQGQGPVAQSFSRDPIQTHQIGN